MYALPEELASDYGSLEGVKVINLPARCGKYPVPAHNQAVVTTSRVRTASAVFCLLSQALSLALAVAIVFNSTDDTLTGFARFGSHQNCL